MLGHRAVSISIGIFIIISILSLREREGRGAQRDVARVVGDCGHGRRGRGKRIVVISGIETPALHQAEGETEGETVILATEASLPLSVRPRRQQRK